MLRKISAFLFLLILVFTSCNQEKMASVNDKLETSPLIGTWKMFYAEIRENDSLKIKDLSKTDFVKIINETHFAFFNQNRDSVNQFYGGGGTYSLVNNEYIETLSFTSVKAIRGHNFPFTIEIKGDTLIQFGLEEVKEANIKRDIIEKYVRILN